MSKRITPEETMVGYFSNEAPAKIEVMFNIIRGIVKSRVPGVVSRKNAKGKAKAAKSTGTQTSFDTSTMAQ